MRWGFRGWVETRQAGEEPMKTDGSRSRLQGWAGNRTIAEVRPLDELTFNAAG